MTKTKRQLRAEAVERLKEPRYENLSDYVYSILGWGHEPHRAKEAKAGLIDLLTDEEPLDGDAAYLIRKLAMDFRADVYKRDECDYLEHLADMVERNYVPREDYEDLESANERQARKIHDVCELNEKLTAEFSAMRDRAWDAESERDKLLASSPASCARCCCSTMAPWRTTPSEPTR